MFINGSFTFGTSTPMSMTTLHSMSSPGDKKLPIVLTILMQSFIILLGIFGNTLVIYLVVTNMKLRNVRNAFMLNLTISNILLLTICSPSYLITVIYADWRLGDFLCKFLHATPVVVILVSSFSIMAIAIDRWMFVVFSRSRQLKSKDALLIVIFIWIFAIILAMPIYFHRFTQNLVNESVIKFLNSIKQYQFSDKNSSLPLMRSYPGFISPFGSNNSSPSLILSTIAPASEFDYLSQSNQYLSQPDLDNVDYTSFNRPRTTPDYLNGIFKGTPNDFLSGIKNDELEFPYKGMTTHAAKDQLFKNFMEERKVEYCVERWKSPNFKRVYVLVLFVLEFVLPCICMLITYIWIIRFLKKHDTKMSHYEQLRKKLIQKERPHQKNCKLLSSMCLAFIICYLPLSLFNIKADFEMGKIELTKFDENEIVTSLSLWTSIESLNAVISPLLYGFLNANFRVEINKTLKKFKTFGKRYQKVNTKATQKITESNDMNLLPK